MIGFGTGKHIGLEKKCSCICVMLGFGKHLRVSFEMYVIYVMMV